MAAQLIAGIFAVPPLNDLVRVVEAPGQGGSCDQTFLFALSADFHQMGAGITVSFLAPDFIRELAVRHHHQTLPPAALPAISKDRSHDWQLQWTVLGVEAR